MLWSPTVFYDDVCMIVSKWRLDSGWIFYNHIISLIISWFVTIATRRNSDTSSCPSHPLPQWHQVLSCPARLNQWPRPAQAASAVRVTKTSQWPWPQRHAGLTRLSARQPCLLEALLGRLQSSTHLRSALWRHQLEWRHHLAPPSPCQRPHRSRQDSPHPRDLLQLLAASSSLRPHPHLLHRLA